MTISTRTPTVGGYRIEQLAASTGAAAVISLIVGSFILPTMPKINDPAMTVQNYFLSHRTSVRVSIYLLGVAVALFAWFLGTIRVHLRKAEGNHGRLSSVAFGAGLITLSIFGVGLVVEAALVFSAQSASPTTTQALYDVLAVSAAIEAFALIPFAGAVAAVGLRHQALPAWLGAGFGVFALYEFIEGAAFSASSGAFAPGDVLNMIGLIAFAVLVLVLSLSLVKEVGKSKASSGNS